MRIGLLAGLVAILALAGSDTTRVAAAGPLACDALARVPLSGGTIVSAINPGAGTWRVEVTCGTTAGSPVLADVANMQLNKNAGAVATLGNPVSGFAPMPAIKVTLAAADTLSIVAIGAATASVIYAAMLTATKVG